MFFLFFFCFLRVFLFCPFLYRIDNVGNFFSIERKKVRCLGIYFIVTTTTS